MAKSTARDMTAGSPLKLILSFMIPLTLGNLFQQFYSLADTIIVGRFLGVDALAAVGSTGAVNFLVMGFVIGLCNGFAIPIAQRFGARDIKDLRRYAGNAVWLAIFFSAVLTLVTVIFARPFLVMTQTPEDIIDGAYRYIVVIFAGIPFLFLYNLLSAVMRALGFQDAAVLPAAGSRDEHCAGFDLYSRNRHGRRRGGLGHGDLTGPVRYSVPVCDLQAV